MSICNVMKKVSEQKLVYNPVNIILTGIYKFRTRTFLETSETITYEYSDSNYQPKFLLELKKRNVSNKTGKSSLCFMNSPLPLFRGDLV